MKLIDRLIKIDRFKINASYALGNFFYDGKIRFEIYDKFDMEFENIYLDRDMKLVIGKDSKCVGYNIARKDVDVLIHRRFSKEKLNDIMLGMISGASVTGLDINEDSFDKLETICIGWKSIEVKNLKISEPSFGFNILSSSAEVMSTNENNLFEMNKVVDVEPKQLTLFE